MLNIAEIKKAFTSLVGFDNDMSAHTQLLQASLKRSSSGTYFQEAHPLITLQVLEETAPRDLTLTHFPEVAIGEYKEGAIVKDGSKLYIAIKDTIYEGTFPVTDWEETSVFSIWLTSKVQASVSKIVQTVLAQSAINNDGRNTLAESALFTGAGYINNIIVNNNNLVGLIIEQKAINSVSLKINRIGFQSTLPGEISLYIFHSSKQLPVKIVPLIKTKANTFEWIVPDNLVLSTYEYDSNGYWILAYNQSELEALGSNAIKNTVNLGQPCATCNQTKILAQFIDVIAFAVNNTGFTGLLWDQDDNIYYTDTNYGLNLDIAVACDFTEIFTRHKNDFIGLLKLQFAVDMLREYLFNANARVNRTSAIASRADVVFALDGDSSKFSRKSGLSYDLERAYAAFNINTKGFNTRCLPCGKSGIKYKSIL